MTPTEELILEVLAARYRTGESHWTFETHHAPALRRLEERGLVTVRPAPTPHLQARLTEAGRRECLMEGWRPPHERITEGIAEDLTDAAALTWWARQARTHGLDSRVVFAIAEAARTSLATHGRLLDDEDAVRLGGGAR